MVNFKINDVFLTYSWKWDLNEDICGICQQGFDQMCSKCKHPLECKPCIGGCNHCFHLHCLNQWLNKRKICPMCRVPWIFKKTFE